MARALANPSSEHSHVALGAQPQSTALPRPTGNPKLRSLAHEALGQARAKLLQHQKQVVHIQAQDLEQSNPTSTREERVDPAQVWCGKLVQLPAQPTMALAAYQAARGCDAVVLQRQHARVRSVG